MSSWNPFITSISGELKPGAKLSLQVTPPGKPAMRFRPTVLAVRPQRELRWRGKLLVAGIFDGEHYFMLEPVGERRTRPVHGENFSGVLVGPLSGMLAAREKIAPLKPGIKQTRPGVLASNVLRAGARERFFPKRQLNRHGSCA